MGGGHSFPILYGPSFAWCPAHKLGMCHATSGRAHGHGPTPTHPHAPPPIPVGSSHAPPVHAPLELHQENRGERGGAGEGGHGNGVHAAPSSVMLPSCNEEVQMKQGTQEHGPCFLHTSFTGEWGWAPEVGCHISSCGSPSPHPCSS
jgi:hypothetical protein